jgi:hypothetical protein
VKGRTNPLNSKEKEKPEQVGTVVLVPDGINVSANLDI